MLDLMLYTVAVHDLDSAAAHYKALFGMDEVAERFHNSIGNFDAVPMGYGDHRVLNLIHPRPTMLRSRA